jgi:hypothetical protein
MTTDLVYEEMLSSEEPETALRRHMRSCADCAFTAARLREMQTAACRPEVPPPPAGAWLTARGARRWRRSG